MMINPEENQQQINKELYKTILKYKELRNVYYSSLVGIYKKESELFKVFQNHKLKK